MLGIFVSSTFRDLKEERRRVREVIDDLAKRFPVRWVGMEEFGALAATPFQVSSAFAEKADIVVLIVAESYGSIAPDRAESFTDAELDVILRDKLPCLAYVKSFDEATLSAEVAKFRRRINSELTSCAWDSADDLARSVRRDLERELQSYSGESSPGGLNFDSQPFGDYTIFLGRDEEQQRLGAALDAGGAVGVWGDRGIGKTALAQRFFSLRRDVYDPIWLRVDDLFGRYADGRPRIGSRRWLKEDLLESLKKALKEHPRAVLIFDNVQSAPLSINWLVERLGDTPKVFLSWDRRAMPACREVISLGSLQKPEGRELLASYCDEEQSYETFEIAELSALLEYQPLLLTLAGRQLRMMPGKSVAELLRELKAAGARLKLESAKADEPTVQALLISSFQCLKSEERQVLSALASLPSRGVSEKSVSWISRHFSGADDPGVSRAVQLRLIEQRKVTDWRGHRYHLRSLIADFLKTTDAFPRGNAAVNHYLMTEEVFEDDSTDIVQSALRLQLDESAPELPQNVWSLNTLVYARPAIRSAAGQLLANWRDEQQCGLLAEEVARLLSTLREEEITLELIALLEKWGREEGVGRLERIWLRPEVKANTFERYFLNNVRVAAGKALAAQQGMPISDFIRRRLNGADRAQVIAALNALSDQMRAELISDVAEKLDDSDPKVRREAADSLASCEEFAPEIADKLLRIFQSDRDEDVQFSAAATLGVQCDHRVLPYFLSLLRDGNSDQRAHALSILWRFPKPEVLDAVYNQAMRDDRPELLENATLVLTDALDLRSGDMYLRLLQSDDQRSNLIGAALACSLERKSLSEDVVKKITDLLAGWLDTGQTALHLAARSALISLHDKRGYQGLCQALKNIDDPTLDSWRSLALMKLASLAPDDFQPLHLRALLQDQSPSVRANSALVAGQYRSRDLVDEIRLLLDDESADPLTQKTVATFANEALDRIAGKRERWQPAPRKPTFKTHA